MDYLNKNEKAQIINGNRCIREGYNDFLKDYAEYENKITDMSSEGSLWDGRAIVYIQFVKGYSLYEFRYYDGENGLERSVKHIRYI